MRVDRVVLVGNRWRKNRLEFRGRIPCSRRQVVLISPDGFASPGFDYDKPPKIPAPLNLMKYFLPKTLLRQNLVSAYADSSRLTEADVDRYYDLLLASGNRAALIDRMQQPYSGIQPPIAANPYAHLVDVGEKDRLIPYGNAADYLRELPDATLVTFPELGHVPHEEAPANRCRPWNGFWRNSMTPDPQETAEILHESAPSRRGSFAACIVLLNKTPTPRDRLRDDASGNRRDRTVAAAALARHRFD